MRNENHQSGSHRQPTAEAREPAVPMISVDHTLRVVDANDAAAALLGFSIQDMTGNLLSEFISSDIPNDWPYSTFYALMRFENPNPTRRLTDFFAVGIHSNGTRIPIIGSTSYSAVDGPLTQNIVLHETNKYHEIRELLSISHDELKCLYASQQFIREQERTHISHELHDDVSQLLASLSIDLDSLAKHICLDDQSALLFQNMKVNLNATFNSIHRIGKNLRPKKLEDGSLFAALQSLRDDFRARSLVSCTLFADEDDLMLNDAASTTIFRIVQEALINIARHSNARTVKIAFSRQEGNLLISIEDDGKGIADAEMAKQGSFGLIGMRERVWDMRGKIEIKKVGNSGTRISITMPIMNTKPGME